MSETLKEKTAKGLFWGGLSSGVQQLLNLVFGIFLARMLDANDYGMVGMLAIFTLIANTLQESGFTAAIANRKEVTHKDYNAVFWFNILLSFCLYAILFFCAPLIAAFYGIPELTPLARYCFLSFLISSFGVAQHAYLFRQLMIKQKAIAQTVSLTLSGITGVILAYNGMAYWGIATQTLVYVTSVAVCYWILSPWRPTLQINFNPIRQMFGFSSRLLITNIFTHINNNIFSVLLGRFFSSAEVGNYTQANKWNYLGYSLVSDTLNSVSQPVLAKINDERLRQQKVFRKLLRFTSFIAFPVMFGISFISRELIVIAITDKWLPAVEILQLLCISGAFIPIIRLYSNLLISRGKSDIYMWSTIGACLVSLIAVIIAHPYGIRNMLIVFVIINTLWLTVWHYFAWREIRITCREALKDILPFGLIAALVMGVTYFITRSIENIYLLCLSKIVIAAPLYIGTLWLLNANILKECIGFLKRKFIRTF